MATKKSAGKKSSVKKTVAKKAVAKKAAVKSSAKKAAKKSARKYSPAVDRKVATEVRAMEEGKLRSGGSGRKVTSRKQAIAIALSEARKEGEKVPPAPKK